MKRFVVWWDLHDVGINLASVLFCTFFVLVVIGTYANISVLAGTGWTCGGLSILVAAADRFITRWNEKRRP